MLGGAFIYCRISEDREGAGLGVGRQREDCEALARERGLEVLEVFEDNDMSAYSGRPRPGYRAMLARLSEVDAVLCWHTDRLHRSPLELEEYINAVKANGVTTYTVKAGELDLSTAHGQLIARQLGSLAAYESQHKAERIARKMKDKALKGEWTGGARPFGWDPVPSTDTARGSRSSELVVNESEAALVKDACSRVLDGESLGSIVKAWNAEGILTSAGKPWGYTQLRQILRRPRNAGIATYQGEEVGRLQAPPIIDEATYRAVVRKLDDPTRRKSRTNRAAYLLSGIATCHCGEVVRKATAISGDWVYPIYRCLKGGGGHVGKRVGPVDVMVESAARRVLALEFADKGAAPEDTARRTDIERQLRDLEAREAEVVDQSASAGVPVGIVLRMAAAIEEERTSLRAELADLEERIARAGARVEEDGIVVSSMLSASGAWDAMDLDARRDWVRHNLRVRLLPSDPKRRRSFDPASVEVTLWDGTPIHFSFPRRTDDEILPHDDPRGVSVLDLAVKRGRRRKKG
ncbi:recombinase family protein [Sinomonas sp. B1-1]|uniref:recombinase family protein n=1 Tax=Sinomonas sp. B1-1 TaxID=3141454 RepID=UPI003D2E023B